MGAFLDLVLQGFVGAHLDIQRLVLGIAGLAFVQQRFFLRQACIFFLLQRFSLGQPGDAFVLQRLQLRFEAAAFFHVEAVRQCERQQDDFQRRTKLGGVFSKEIARHQIELVERQDHAPNQHGVPGNAIVFGGRVAA